MSELHQSLNLHGRALVIAAGMVSPRSMMQLPQWSRSARSAVQQMLPEIDPIHGCVGGRKVAITWHDRLQQMETQAEQITRLVGGGEKLTVEECKSVCACAGRALAKEPNIVDIMAPIVIVGSIQGHFLDLLSIFRVSGDVPETNYLFLGNYVNRGYDSCRTMSLLLLLKARHPSRVVLLRGKHEQRQMTQTYTFYSECIETYHPDGITVWQCFVECFDRLPFCAIVANQIFCVPSGLSPSIDNLDQIRSLNRFQDIPNNGPLVDLVWSEPDDRDGWGVSPKGLGCTFGPDTSLEFCHNNRLSFIVRSSQMVAEGHQWTHDGSVATLFSAPNYVNRCGNQGAVMEFDENLELVIKCFDATPWPKQALPMNGPVG